MGFILRFLERTTAKIATKVVRKTVEKAVVSGAILAAGSVAAVAETVKQEKNSKERTLIESSPAEAMSIYPIYQISVSKENDKKQKKVYKTIAPYVEELNERAEGLYELLEQLYETKIQLLDCFVQYTEILDKIEGLPEKPEVSIRYKIKTPSFKELSNYIKGCSQTFKGNQSLKIHVAKRGFIKCRNKSFESINRLFSVENQLSIIDASAVDNLKKLVSEIEKLCEDYDELYDYVEDDCNKLQTCYERYLKIIHNFESAFKKTKQYSKISKLVSSSYSSTVLILDLINTSLVEKEKVNDEVLDERMDRRMI